MSHLFTGTGVALFTPFNDWGQVDYTSLSQLVNFLIQNQSQALIVNGTTGESSTLTKDEKEKILKTVVDLADSKVKVIANVGTNNTAQSIENAKAAQALGADGLLLITPYYNKTNQRGLIKHYESILGEVDLPAILYDVPGRTGMRIELATLEELSHHPQIIGLKDATGDLDFFKQAKERVQDTFSFYSGNDGNIQSYYQLGGHGVISVLANVLPSDFQQVYDQPEGNYQALFDLVEALNVDVNPIPIKALAHHLNLAQNKLRLPLVELGPKEEIELIKAYQRYHEGVQSWILS